MFFLLLLHLSILVSHRSCLSEVELLSEILRQFQNYNVAYHYNSSQIKELENLLQVTVNQNQQVYLINYGINQNTSKMLSKMSRNEVLHMVLLEKQFLLWYSINNLNHKNVVVIASKTSANKKQQTAICETKALHRAKAVFIITLADTRISTCCYYCGKHKVGLRTIPNRNRSVPELKKYFNNFKNFHGYTFKIGYNEYPPFFYT